MKQSINAPRNVTTHGYSIKDISANLGVSKGFLVAQIKTGKLRARRFGRRVIVLGSDLDAYLNSAEPVAARREDRE
jgi:excisionase family DNA binding protein